MEREVKEMQQESYYMAFKVSALDYETNKRITFNRNLYDYLDFHSTMEFAKKIKNGLTSYYGGVRVVMEKVTVIEVMYV